MESCLGQQTCLPDLPMPAKSLRNTRTRPPHAPEPNSAEQATTEQTLHQGEETAVNPSAYLPGHSEIYQLGDLWDERETEFFRPYLEMLQRQGCADDGHDDQAVERHPG